jgi:hypothetical protein
VIDREDPWLDHPPLVPHDFKVPLGLWNQWFVLEPLEVRDNVADYRAWTTSIGHIRSTPGFEGRSWPDPALTLEDNEREVARHAAHFAPRVGFIYTVLDPSDLNVIGCVYLYPSRTHEYDVDVRSWVRADKAELDKPLYEAVRQWLIDDWPFGSPEYAAR